MRRPFPPAQMRGVLLDLDGTLVDTEPLHKATADDVLAQIGVTLTVDDYRALAGKGDVDFFRALDARHAFRLSVAEVITRRTALVVERAPAFGLRANPGVGELLDLLDGRGLPRAVASGSARAQIDALLGAAGLLPRLPVRVSGHDDVPRQKPAPDVYLAAADALGLRAQACLAVEDSRTGVASARAAGCFVVWVPSPSFPCAQPDGVDLPLASLHELVALLQVHFPVA